MIVVLGGDGTINEVLNGIHNFDEVVLSYIPSGSSNDFARNLGISSNPKKALATVLAPEKQIFLDIGELELLDSNNQVLETRRFAISSGIGYDAEICYEALTSKLKKFLNRLHLGKLTYGLIAAKQVFCYPFVSGTLLVDGAPYGFYKDILFLVGMIQPCEGGGAKLAPQAKCDDKKLSVCFVHNLKRWQVFFLLPTAFFAKHTRFKGVDIFDCETLELIQSSEKITHTDGEYSGTGAHIRMYCNKHRILVNTPL